jgi:hypothetical protein
MKRIVKQVVGIDVAQAELVVMFGRMHDDWLTELVSRKSFPNNKKGLIFCSNGLKSYQTVRCLFGM